MKIINASEYSKKIVDFCKKNELIEIETIPFSFVDNGYKKVYKCEKGTLYEINRIVYEKVDIEVKGIKTSVKVKLYEHEQFDTDSGVSTYFYETLD